MASAPGDARCVRFVACSACECLVAREDEVCPHCGVSLPPAAARAGRSRAALILGLTAAVTAISQMAACSAYGAAGYFRAGGAGGAPATTTTGGSGAGDIGFTFSSSSAGTGGTTPATDGGTDAGDAAADAGDGG
jgi:hypothetical protein